MSCLACSTINHGTAAAIHDRHRSDGGGARRGHLPMLEQRFQVMSAGAWRNDPHESAHESAELPVEDHTSAGSSRSLRVEGARRCWCDPLRLRDCGGAQEDIAPADERVSRPLPRERNRRKMWSRPAGVWECGGRAAALRPKQQLAAALQKWHLRVLRVALRPPGESARISSRERVKAAIERCALPRAHTPFDCIRRRWSASTTTRRSPRFSLLRAPQPR